MRTSSTDVAADVQSTRPPADLPGMVKHSARASRKRSLVKTFSWRIVATLTTFLIAWVVTGNLAAGAAIGGVEAVTKMVLYYGHERVWETIS